MPVDAPLSAPENWDDPPDNEPARKARKFIRSCPVTDGEKGRPLGETWLPWEERATRHIFGTLRDDGRRKYQTVYIEMPKKSGKSHWAAAVMLYLLVADDEYGAQLYSAAYKQDQAKVVWGIAREMVKQAPWLRQRLEVKDYLNLIECPALSGTYKPITRKAVGQHGFNPSAVCFDELHTQPDRDLWDAIDDSMGARSEPLLLAITNSGHDRQSICYQQREYAMALNAGEFTDPSFLGVVYGTDPEEKDIWEPETWRRSNPGLGVTVGEEWLAQKAEQARRMPTKQNAFKRWQLGIWTQQDTRWLNPEDWKRCERGFSEDELVGMECYGGLDLGEVSDLTAWVKAFPDPDDPETIRVTCEAWCPRARLHDDTNPYRATYQAWAREGWLEVVDTLGGRVMDYGEVRRKTVADHERFDLVDLAVDKAFQGNQLLVELVEDEGLTAVGMRTTYNDMTSPCDELERRIQTEPPKILHDGNPVLAWAISNVALRQPDDDRKRPVKDAEDAKIDPVVALLMALDRAQRHEKKQAAGWLL